MLHACPAHYNILSYNFKLSKPSDFEEVLYQAVLCILLFPLLSYLLSVISSLFLPNTLFISPCSNNIGIPLMCSTHRHTTNSSWFPFVYKQMLRRFPRFQVTTACFSCSPPDLNSFSWISGNGRSSSCRWNRCGLSLNTEPYRLPSLKISENAFSVPLHTLMAFTGTVLSLSHLFIAELLELILRHRASCI